MEVIVAFGSGNCPNYYYSYSPYNSSFDVALGMANEANEINEGTVITLVLNSRYYGYLNCLKDVSPRLNETTSKFRYELAIKLNIRDCGDFKGPLGEKVKDALPYVSTFIILVEHSKKFRLGRNYNAEVVHKILLSKFEECEKKLKAEKEDVKLVPAVSVLPPADVKGNWLKEFISGWELMSRWAESNDREVIMFKAFDSSPMSYIDNMAEGWWRLRDRSQYEITRDAFIEKVCEVNLTSTRSENWQGNPDWDEDIEGKEFYVPEVVYILLLLLSLVCSLMVVAVAVLVLRSNSKRLESHLKIFYLKYGDVGSFDININGQQAALFPGNGENLYGESGDNEGSSLGFNDKSPFVTVTDQKDNRNEQ